MKVFDEESIIQVVKPKDEEEYGIALENVQITYKVKTHTVNNIIIQADVCRFSIITID